MDDDWDSGDDEKQMQHKEWNRVEQGLEKIGYKEGMESIQEDTLQVGFNEAFKQAVSMAFGAGILQGAICASMGRKNMAPDQDSNKTSDSLEILNGDISSLLMEMPDILCAKDSTESCLDCSCSAKPAGNDGLSVDDCVKIYWSRLKNIQEKAMKEDKYLDSSLLPQE